MQRAYPSVADEGILLDDVDLQPVNREGSTHDIVDKAEEWTFEAVVEDAGDEDATNKDEVNKIIMVA
jgi:hypothetical protein